MHSYNWFIFMFVVCFCKIVDNVHFCFVSVTVYKKEVKNYFKMNLLWFEIRAIFLHSYFCSCDSSASRKTVVKDKKEFFCVCGKLFFVQFLTVSMNLFHTY